MTDNPEQKKEDTDEGKRDHRKRNHPLTGGNTPAAPAMVVFWVAVCIVLFFPFPRQGGRYPYDQAIRSSSAVADSVVYVGSDDHTLYAFDAATGSLKWKYEAGLEIADAPAVVNGAVYFASGDGYVYAVG